MIHLGDPKNVNKDCSLKLQYLLNIKKIEGFKND
jgi:hypothetical protein